ncbi:MAG: hypothetical protein H6Q10_2376 [Acidobacteria bacterium]|nr:hypothetical protein [Acidobacteriota bacterium]
MSGTLGRWPWSGRATLVVAAVVIVAWNAVFDSRMKAAIWDYVDRQQLYVAGEAPPVDIDAAMAAGVHRGLRDATVAAALAGALVAAVARRSRR